MQIDNDTSILQKRLDYYEHLIKNVWNVLYIAEDLVGCYSKAIETIDSNRIIEAALNSINSLIPSHIIAYYQVNNETFEFEPLMTIPQNQRENFQNEVKILIDNGYFGWGIRQNKISIFKALLLEKFIDKSILFVPINVGPKTLGVILILTQEKGEVISQELFKLIELVGSQLSFIIENLYLYKSLRAENNNLQLLNITLKKSEENALASLKEKELLLREIHHRVKNNMHVITSLLKLQCGYIKDPVFADIMQECQDRIKSMAYAHENLYRSHDLVNIDLKEYLNSIITNILQTHFNLARRVQVESDIENINIQIDSAIPFGLVVNELLSNCFKHALPPEENINVFISVKFTEEKLIEFIIANNGISFPEHIDFRNTESLGLQLVVMLIEDQLDGTVELCKEHGTTFKIKFKELLYKKRN